MEQKVIPFYSQLKNGYEVFSNFARAEFTHKGISFYSVEQFFMWNKAKLFKDEKVADKILTEENPLRIKQLGRKVFAFDKKVWDERFYSILKNGMYLKFSQNPELKEKLLSTGDAILAEANLYDKFYGIGLNANVAPQAVQDVNSWKGENITGKALMEVREYIRSKS